MVRSIVAALLLVPALAFAGPHGHGGPGGPGEDDPEIQKLHREIAAIKLDKTLSLTRDQAKALLPVLDKADALRKIVEAERAKQKPEVARALAAIRDDVRRDGVASEASKKALREARGKGFKENRGELRELGEQIRTILTEEQKEKLKEFDPSPAGGLEKMRKHRGKGEGKGGKGMHGGHGGPGGPGGPGGGGRMLMQIALSPEFRDLVKARAK